MSRQFKVVVTECLCFKVDLACAKSTRFFTYPPVSCFFSASLSFSFSGARYGPLCFPFPQSMDYDSYKERSDRRMLPASRHAAVSTRATIYATTTEVSVPPHGFLFPRIDCFSRKPLEKKMGRQIALRDVQAKGSGCVSVIQTHTFISFVRRSR